MISQCSYTNFGRAVLLETHSFLLTQPANQGWVNRKLCVGRHWNPFGPFNLACGLSLSDLTKLQCKQYSGYVADLMGLQSVSLFLKVM